MNAEAILREEIREKLAALDLEAIVNIEELHSKLLLSPAEVQRLYGITIRQLEDWRRQGRGPRYVSGEGKTGRVKYRRSDLDEYVSRKVVRTYDCQ